MAEEIGRTPASRRSEADSRWHGWRKSYQLYNKIFPVAMRPGDTPVPIPNTMVKTWTADGTMLETAWESRWLPGNLGD